MKKLSILAILVGSLFLTGGNVWADVLHADDVIVQGSLCAGSSSCFDGEVFSGATLKLKENTPAILAEDTSGTGFPSNDWQITFNDGGLFGLNKFSIDDIGNGTTPFTIEAGAPNNSIFVDDSGRVGLGTFVPLNDLHIIGGGTAGISLEENSGVRQVWSVAGNSNNFSIRDVTNFSNMPFKILPGASTNSLVISATSRIGLGTGSPAAKLHVLARAGGATPRMLFENPDAIGGNQQWFFDIKDGNGDFRISRLGSGVQELKLTPSGSITIPGNFISGGTTLNVPDYVFDPGYDLLPLDELSSFIEREKHLPNIPTAEEIHKDGINITAFQMKLLEKVEELTLYVVAQEQTIRELKERLEGIESAKN